ncbi:MAG: competence/damage-inducible protein A [Elusimicrobia bacterium CG06_land_8_20_14_3_00_38_11]|nr:MAG: competence/damage-inducible protein A [Elusimicrobia bacterium CG06_land_8_20_14_3_00_38_11]
MHIEIICIGSELLVGSVNTNSAYISEKLATIGLKVNREITVGDDFPQLENVFSESFNRSNIIITTGGLGPTFDDITRETVSKATGKKLILNKNVLKTISEFFEKKKIKMPKDNEKQSYLLEGAEIIPNGLGTAPGQILEMNSKIIILLPGPPREIKPMFENTVLPYLKKRFEKGLLKIKILHTVGLAESVIDEKIRKIVDIERKLEGSEVSFSILAKHTGVDIKIIVSGTDEMLIDQMIQNLKREFYNVLKDFIFGEDNQTLESAVGQLILKKRKTLAVAESCTGGLISHRLTNVAGSSMYFKEGIVTYSDSSKKRMLGVKDETLNKYGAVSSEVAKEMAEGIKKISGTNFGISTTGIAGPKPSSTGKPVGLVFIGIASDAGTKVQRFQFTGSRVEIKDKIATAALDILRMNLI